MATVGQQKQSGWPYSANIYEQSNAKPIKVCISDSVMKAVADVIHTKIPLSSQS